MVLLHEGHPNVYILKTDLDDAWAQSKSVAQFIKICTEKVYTEEALIGSTAQGYPSRSGGKKRMLKATVLPRLHPDGRAAILGMFIYSDYSNIRGVVGTALM